MRATRNETLLITAILIIAIMATAALLTPRLFQAQGATFGEVAPKADLDRAVFDTAVTKADRQALNDLFTLLIRIPSEEEKLLAGLRAGDADVPE